MRWEGRRESTNVEDRRGMGGGAMLAGGGLGAIVIAILVTLLGGNPGDVLGPQAGGGGGLGGQPQGGTKPSSPEEEKLKHFVSVVLADTEDVWTDIFKQMGKRYAPPTLVLFSGSVQSACGSATASVGPFYCPGDQKLYIDLSFYAQLRDQLGAGGDFAQAYVIAHEIGHHIQHLLDYSRPLDEARGTSQEKGADSLSVRLELQADFLAGVWARKAQDRFQVLEQGDLEEALNAASKIGDDTLQQRGQGRVRPDSFTHGTSAQRVAWFRHGFQTADLAQGNTFDDATYFRVSPR